MFQELTIQMGMSFFVVGTKENKYARYSENILSWSVNPSNWGGTRTSNALTSPDGSNSADLISVIQQSGVYMQGYECYRRNYLFYLCLRKANIGNINIEVCCYVYISMEAQTLLKKVY